MIDTTAAIHIDPEILGGIPVFAGTRVPLQNLIDYLSAGDTPREQAVAALRPGAQILEQHAIERAQPHGQAPRTATP